MSQYYFSEPWVLTKLIMYKTVVWKILVRTRKGRLWKVHIRMLVTTGRHTPYTTSLILMDIEPLEIIYQCHRQFQRLFRGAYTSNFLSLLYVYSIY